MTIIEIVSNLGLLYTAICMNPELCENPVIKKQLEALKRAMQILISVDLKQEMEELSENE